MVEELQGEVHDAMEDLRDLARGIYPPLLADHGLVAALEAQARKAPVPVEIESDSLARYPQDAEAAVYFCALEALQNVAKYAQAKRALVRLHQEDHSLVFEVSDDGVGFDPEARGYGTGLQGMTDRLAALGGGLEIESTPGQGTTVRGAVPVGPGASQPSTSVAS
jgi:signal transduction histidine kinase